MSYRLDPETRIITRVSYNDDATMTLSRARPERLERYRLRRADPAYAAFAEAMAAQEADGIVLTPPESAPAPLAYDASAAPTGSRVLVRIQTGEVFVFSGADLAEPVILQDPGAYRLIHDVPEPHVGFSVDLELS